MILNGSCFVFCLFWIAIVKGQNYTVTSVLEYPYLIQDGEGKFTGFVVDMLDEMAKRGKFSYDLTLADDGLYGSEVNGQWTGMIGELIDSSNDIDIAAAPLIVTEKRRKVVSFTRSFQTSSHRILVKKPVLEFHPFKVLFQPFSLALWIMVIVICLIISAMLFIVNKFSPSEWSKVKPEDDPTNARDSFSANNAFFFVHSTLTWQGYKEVPRSPAGRILVTMWFSFVFFMILAYGANLTAFLIARDTDKPVLDVASWEDMIAQSSVPYGFLMGGIFFRHAKDPTTDQTLQIVARNVETRYSYFSGFDEAVKRVREGNYLAIVPADVGMKYVDQQPCDLLMVGARVLQWPEAFACRDSLICSMLSDTIVHMTEDGTIYKFQQKWLHGNDNCPSTNLESYISKRETARLTARPLSIADASLAFVVLLLGIVLSMIFLIIEVLVHGRRKTKSATVSSRGSTNKCVTDEDVEKANLTEQEKAPIATNEA